MITEDNNLPDDKQLSSLYRQTKDELPTTHLDDTILSAAKRETRSFSLPYNPFSNNWHIPASLAAVLVLSFGIVTLMENDFIPVDGVSPLALEEGNLFQQPEEPALTTTPRKTDELSFRKPKTKKHADSKKELSQHDMLAIDAMEEEKALRKKQSIQKIKPKAAGISAPAFMTDKNITTGTDEQARLPYWQYQDDGLSIRLIQRLPDQTRGFFIARGFSIEHAELIAQSCVFQTIFKNISDKNNPSAITYNLLDWVVTHNGVDRKMKTREKWATLWQQLNIASPAKLAFEWGLLPTAQDYQSGDYNWGMAIFDIPPASNFSLKLTWQQYGKQHSVTIPNMQCAADIHANPEMP